MKLLQCLAFLFAGAIALAQSSNYLATANTTALTIQSSAASSGKSIQLQTGSVYCVAAQTVTLAWNGTAATTTAGTALRVPGTTSAATANVFTASNVGAGTTGPVYNILAGGTFLLDLSKLQFSGGGGAGPSNFTLSTSGTCTITIQWSEGV